MKIGDKVKFKITDPIMDHFEIGEVVTITKLHLSEGLVTIKESIWRIPIVCFIPNFKKELYISVEKIKRTKKTRYKKYYTIWDWEYDPNDLIFTSL